MNTNTATTQPISLLPTHRFPEAPIKFTLNRSKLYRKRKLHQQKRVSAEQAKAFAKASTLLDATMAGLESKEQSKLILQKATELMKKGVVAPQPAVPKVTLPKLSQGTELQDVHKEGEYLAKTLVANDVPALKYAPGTTESEMAFYLADKAVRRLSPQRPFHAQANWNHELEAQKSRTIFLRELERLRGRTPPL